jgi:hypothetical protein
MRQPAFSELMLCKRHFRIPVSLEPFLPRLVLPVPRAPGAEFP